MKPFDFLFVLTVLVFNITAESPFIIKKKSSPLMQGNNIAFGNYNYEPPKLKKPGHTAFANDQLKNSLILVYTKNGKGYVHDNIAAAVASIKELAVANKFKADITDDPAVFNEANLKKYTLLIFISTNNDVFDTDSQRVAFRRYIEAGGGFVGVHSITGTERNWKWFKMMIGGTFAWHAKFQKFSIKNIDPTHPSMKNVPTVWEREDECYFGKELYPGIKVLMMHDLGSLRSNEADLIQKNSGSFADYYPAVW